MSGRRKAITFRVKARGCHICTSHAMGHDGYPTLWKDGRGQHMHRVLYEEMHGPIGKRRVARHTCDDTMCINLKHVVPGTNRQNARDMVARGRCNTHRGETRSDAKLKAADVRAIRRSKWSQCALARKYKVNQSTISRIQNMLRRRHDGL